MQSAQEEALNPSEKRYARLSERIGHNESCEAQRASNEIYQCVGVQHGIWLLKPTATHHLTMISRIKLLQLIHIDWLRKLIFVQNCQPGNSLSGQISDNIQLAPARSELSRVADQSHEDLQN